MSRFRVLCLLCLVVMINTVSTRGNVEAQSADNPVNNSNKSKNLSFGIDLSNFLDEEEEDEEQDGNVGVQPYQQYDANNYQDSPQSNNNIENSTPLPVTEDTSSIDSNRPLPIIEDTSNIDSNQPLPIIEDTSSISNNRPLPIIEDTTSINNNQPLQVTNDLRNILNQQTAMQQQLQRLELLSSQNQQPIVPIQPTLVPIQPMVVQPPTTQVVTTKVANNEDKSNPSFLERFLQNITGQNDTSPEDQMNDRRERELDQRYQTNRNYDDYNMLRQQFDQMNSSFNSNRSFAQSNESQINPVDMLRSNSSSRRSGLTDDEFVQETIRYLRDLGVINESKLSKLNLRDIGTCMLCGKNTIVTKFGQERSFGICKDCMTESIAEAKRGKYIKRDRSRGYSEERGFGRSSDRDYRDDRYTSRDREDSESKSSLGGLIGKLTGGDSVLGGLASAALDTVLAKKKDKNSETVITEIEKGVNDGQYVLDASGQLVPLSSYNDPRAPYGYKKDPITGQMVPAANQAEGIIAARQVLDTAKASLSSTGGAMVFNAAGQLVPSSSLAGTGAPYGYVKDPITGQMRPATSLAEAQASVQQAVNSGQLVMDANGNLVPAGSTPGAPYGYVKDPVTGQMRPANSPEEARNAAQQALTASNAALAAGGAAGAVGAAGVAGAAGAGGGAMVFNAAGQLVPSSSLAGTGAPYGYVKDPVTGQMRPATSLAEAQSSVQQAVNSGQLVMDANGNLVPAGSTPGAPYGYVKDPVTGQMRPANSPEEARNAAQQALSASNAALAAAGAVGAAGVAGAAGAGGGAMVFNAAGQLVPSSSLAGTGAPYGYVKDPVTGQMRPATSLAEAQSSVQQAVNSGQLVMDANGNLVPAGSTPGAPYGYIKDPVTGQMRPANSPDEARNAAQQALSASNAALGAAGGVAGAVGAIGAAGAGGGAMVFNAAGQLVPSSSLAGTGAPYGYVKDPVTGQMRPATSLAEAQSSVQQAVNSGQLVMDATGNLVPAGSTPGAPYGYIKDPVTGQMRPANSPDEARNAAQQALSASNAALAAGGAAGAAGAAGSGTLVYNAAGQLVPVGSLAGTNAPYGYVKDPVTGQMRPATSLAEAQASVQQGINSGQIVIDANGNLVPAGSTPGAPYGYTKDPVTGQMVPATSPDQAKMAAQQGLTQNKNILGQLVSTLGNNQKTLLVGGAVVAATAAGAAALYGALKKNKTQQANTQTPLGSNGNSGGIFNNNQNNIASGNTVTNAGTVNNANTGAVNNANTGAVNNANTGNNGQFTKSEITKAKKNYRNLIKRIEQAKTALQEADQTLRKNQEKLQQRENALAQAQKEGNASKIKAAQTKVQNTKTKIADGERMKSNKEFTITNLEKQKADMEQKYGANLK